jgi:hypothetical protein
LEQFIVRESSEAPKLSDPLKIKPDSTTVKKDIREKIQFSNQKEFTTLNETKRNLLHKMAFD